MRNIKKYLTALSTKVKSITAFPRHKLNRKISISDGSGNLQVKIIRMLLLIPLALFLESEYYLIFNSANTFVYTPVKISSITPKILNTQEIIFTNSIDTSEININVSSDSSNENYLHISVNPVASSYKSIFVSMLDSVSVNANLIIKCKNISQRTLCRIDIIDSLLDEKPLESGDYYLYTTIPHRKQAELVIPLNSFRKDKDSLVEQSTESNFHNSNIQIIKITFYPSSSTTLDLSDIRFEWGINKRAGIVLLLLVMMVGSILFFRTSVRNPNFSERLDLVSPPVTARVVFFIAAISAFISIFTNSFPTHHHEVYLIYISFLLLICADEFYNGEITKKPVWSLRYFVLIIAVWLFKITDNTFILSPLTLAAFIPVIQQRRRILLLSVSAGMLVIFIVINKYRYFIPDANGTLIIVGASVIAIVMKEVLFYELLKSESDHAKFLYENLFENSYDGIYTTDEHGIIKTANYGFGNMLGYPIDDVIGKNIFNYVVKEDHHLLTQLMEEAVSKDFNMCDINFIDINKSVHTSLIRLVAVYKNNVLTGYQSIATDITERKLNEQELWKSQSRYKALLNAIPDLVLKFTREGILLDYHAQNSQDSAKYYEKLVGKNINNVFEPNITQYFLIHAENAFKKFCPQIFEYELGTNGDVTYEEARIVPVQNDNFIAIIRDITDRRHAEFRIQEYLMELDENRITL